MSYGATVDGSAPAPSVKRGVFELARVGLVACGMFGASVVSLRRAARFSDLAAASADAAGAGMADVQPPGIQKTTVSSSDAQWALRDLIALVPSSQTPWADDGCAKYGDGFEVSCERGPMVAGFVPGKGAAALPADLACTCTCGVLGRVALESSSAALSGYGLHHVEATGRPHGFGLDVKAVEDEFAKRYDGFKTYDRFMDFGTRLYAYDLRPHVAKLAAAGKPFLALTWSSGGTDYASVVFQVGRSAGVLEFFSDNFDAAELRTLASGYEVSRAPRFAFEAGAAPGDVFAWDDSEYVQAAAVSHFVSDLERSHAFQTDVLGMTQIDEFVRGDDLTRVYVTAPNSDAPFAAVQVHLTYRPEVAGEAFSVRDFEDVLNAAHDATLVDAYCGFDTWLDFHYAVSGTGISVKDFMARCDAAGLKYHFTDEAERSDDADVNMYVVAPNGVAVQLISPPMGDWTPEKDVGDAAGDLCGTGTC